VDDERDIVTLTTALGEPLAAAVERRRRIGTAAAPSGRGAFIGEADVDAALARITAPVPDDHQRPAPGRLDKLGELLGLNAFELDVLVAATAVELDGSFGVVYAYLNDSADLPVLTPGLALELGGVVPWHPVARHCMAPGGRLASAGLLRIEPTASFPRRRITVPDRVVEHLLGVDDPVQIVRRHVRPIVPVEHPAVDAVSRLLEAGEWFVYLRGGSDQAAPSFAAGAFERLGIAPLYLDLRAAPATDTAELLRQAVREVTLQQLGLVVGPVDALAEAERPALDELASTELPVVVYGTGGWDPSWSRAAPATLDVPGLDLVLRRQLWVQALEGAGVEFDAGLAAGTFHIPPGEVAATIRAARLDAAARGCEVDLAAIAHGARARNAVALERSARRVTPRATFQDLVLPAASEAELVRLVAWVRNRDRVIDEFGVRGQGTKGRGVAGLFAGPSGTGKTLAAEVVAGELGLDLYVIDLSTVISKYIGETEENLERVFTEATGINGILFFDEADALFGKRSGVSDARDRYANVEVAYLLQRMEQFDGLSLLATNLRANLDAAFTRRLDFMITFTEPEHADRLRLWRAHLPATLPLADDVDLDELARRLKLCGGDISNAARAAAHAATRDDGPVTMAHLVNAVAREYGKLGRLVRPEELGPLMDLVERVG
jgi:ATPase family protein associated with various cellular activities (AAA)/winged helix domain-containing protein